MCRISFVVLCVIGLVMYSSCNDDSATNPQPNRHTVTGRVVDSEGNGIAGVTVTLSGSDKSYNGTSAGNGIYTIENVSEGLYLISATKENYDFKITTEEITVDGVITIPNILGEIIASENDPDPDVIAQYQVDFIATWGQETHPVDFPVNAHFSGLIGAVHKGTTSFWKEGLVASDGIEQMAETGGKTLLGQEIDSRIISGNAYVRLSANGISSSPGTVNFRFSATREQHFVTLVSMMVPSPDWFVGVSGVDLFQDGDWLDSLDVPLYVYDAGTDSGATFNADNIDTKPRGKIVRKDDYAFKVNGSIISVGAFIFTRLD